MSAPKAMEEKRKKFGMEMLPSLHKRLKQLAADREVPLWSLTQQAIEQWLLREVLEKDERQMTDSTDSSKVVNEIGTFRSSDPPIDRKIPSIGHQVDDQGEITSSERIASEISARDSADTRVEAALKEIIEALAELRTRMGGMEKSSTRTQKATKRVNRGRRVAPRRKGKHPPSAQSGA